MLSTVPQVLPKDYFLRKQLQGTKKRVKKVRYSLLLLTISTLITTLCTQISFPNFPSPHTHTHKHAHWTATHTYKFDDMQRQGQNGMKNPARDQTVTHLSTRASIIRVLLFLNLVSILLRLPAGGVPETIEESRKRARCRTRALATV